MNSIHGILEDYLSRLDRGEAPDRSDYFARFPEHTAELSKFFNNLDFLDTRLAAEPGARNGSDASSFRAPLGPLDEAVLTSGESELPSIKGFEIIAELGRGSQGVVYKARQLGTKRVVALKVVRDGLFASVAERKRFETEVELASRLAHPNIVSVYHCGRDGGREHFAMEYVEGEPLDVYLASRALDIRTTLRLFVQLCGAVAYAHQRGVIHRDLKPSNMIVDGLGMIHVLDFGLAKSIPGMSAAPTSTMTHVGEFAGTWYYASPEQAARDPELVDVRTDVYALGVVLYELLTDCYPYPVVGETRETVAKHIRETPASKPSTIRSEINDELDTIVLHALHKEPGARYQSVAAFADDVERYLAGEPIVAKRDSRWYLLYATTRKYRWYVAMTLAGFAAVIVLAFAYAVLYWRAAAAQETAELRSQMGRRVQVDLVARLDELNSLTNRFAAAANAHPDLTEGSDRRRTLFSGSLSPWVSIASQAPANLLEKTLDPASPGHAEAIDWLARHEAQFAELQLIIESHNLGPVSEHNSEWERRSHCDSLSDPDLLISHMAAYAGWSHLRGDTESAVNWLHAGRRFAVDLADGHFAFHKAYSIMLRDKLYDVALLILSHDQPDLIGDAILRWISHDPPLVGYRLSLIAEGLKIEQLWESSTFATSPGEGFIDPVALDKWTGGMYRSIGRHNFAARVSPHAAQELTREYIGELQRWDDLAVPALQERRALLREKVEPSTAWPLLEVLAPRIGESLRFRAGVNAKRSAVILAASVLRYFRESGHWPSALQDAASVSIIDPYSGQPFGYSLLDDGFVIYSINMDGIDNGGQPGKWEEPNTDVVLFPMPSISFPSEESSAAGGTMRFAP